MSLGLTVLLLGLFGVPLALLVWGHRLRKRGPRSQAAFWGAVAGHVVGATLALIFAMLPPEGWAAGDLVRGFFGFWGLLLFPLLAAAIRGARRPTRS